MSVTPRFLIDDTAGLDEGRIFVVHTRSPRFVAEVLYEGEDFAILGELVFALPRGRAAIVLEVFESGNIEARTLEGLAGALAAAVDKHDARRAGET